MSENTLYTRSIRPLFSDSFMRIVFNRRHRLRDQDSKSETHAMTAVNGAFDTVVDAETLEESPPAAEELG